jgi:hypothetical protein
VQAVLRDSGAVLQIDPKNSDALANEANANLQLGYPRVWDVKLFDIQDNRDDVVYDPQGACAIDMKIASSRVAVLLIRVPHWISPLPIRANEHSRTTEAESHK